MSAATFSLTRFLFAFAHRYSSGVYRSLRRLRIGRSGVDIHIALKRRDRDLAVDVGYFVLSPRRVHGRDGQAAHADSQGSRGIHRHATVIENNFIALELDNRFFIEIDRRPHEFDACCSLRLSFDGVPGNKAAEAGAALRFSRTPPLPRNMATPLSSAASEAGKVAMTKTQTKLRLFDKATHRPASAQALLGQA
jgi:hypothetical protein